MTDARTGDRGGVLFAAAVVLCGVGFVAAPHLVFQVAPVEPQMGLIQKIFYYHVSCAWLMLLSAILAGVGGGVFLLARRPWGDRLGEAATEMAVVFGVLVLTTGPLWAKKAWGHYWVWDARLTTLLVLFLTFLAAGIARRQGGAVAARLAAGVALFGALNVPLVYVSVRVWRTNHPPATVVSTMSPVLQPAFWVSLATFCVFFTVLLAVRLRLRRQRDLADELAAQLPSADE